MNFKGIALIVFVLASAWQLFMLLIRYRSAGNPVPENVRDVYDADTYDRWKRYHAEKCHHALIEEGVSAAVTLALLAGNAHAAVSGWLGGGWCAQAIAVVLFVSAVEFVCSIGLSYYDTMVIEEKYGFNRSTKKTFAVDQVKSFVIGIAVNLFIVLLLGGAHRLLGDWMALAFAAALFVIILFVSFIAPVLTRIFNRFTPLEDGELKDKLTALLNGHGYKVRAIKVMDASRRTTKANAYFTGFGRMKTIVLYDTLVNSSTPEEICAVFAHEMGHGLNRDVLKGQALSFLNIALIALLAWLTVRTPEIFTAFGFAGVNYGFAYVLLGSVELALLSPLVGLVTGWHSRRAEYRADRVAAEEGYGEALISGLKKLARGNFSALAPSELEVKLSYSHPPLHKRIAAIEKAMRERSHA